MKTQIQSLKSRKLFDESTFSSSSDETDSDDEFGEDLGKLAIQVANEMRSKMSSSPTRVMNLRNKNITIDLTDEQTPSFYIDKKPNDTEREPSVSATTSKAAASLANNTPSSSDDDDDDYDDDIGKLAQQKAKRKQSEFQRWEK